MGEDPEYFGESGAHGRYPSRACGWSTASADEGGREFSRADYAPLYVGLLGAIRIVVEPQGIAKHTMTSGAIRRSVMFIAPARYHK